MTIAENYRKLQDLLPADRSIKIVAVTKYATIPQMIEAYEAGLRDFGENKIQDVERRFEELPADVVKNVRWHFIGHLQKNKSKKAVQHQFEIIHSVDSLALAQKLSSHAESLQYTQPVLLQVNITREPQKTGFLEEALRQEFAQIMGLPCLDIRGLMTIGPHADDDGASLRCFQDLHDLREALHDRFQYPLPELSMGMSKDFHHAIETGATIIRIGSHLFGGYP